VRLFHKFEEVSDILTINDGSSTLLQEFCVSTFQAAPVFLLWYERSQKAALFACEPGGVKGAALFASLYHNDP